MGRMLDTCGISRDPGDFLFRHTTPAMSTSLITASTFAAAFPQKPGTAVPPFIRWASNGKQHKHPANTYRDIRAL